MCNGHSTVNYLGTAANAEGKWFTALIFLPLIVQG